MKQIYTRLTTLAIILTIPLVFLPTAALSAEYTYTTIDVPGSSYMFASGINDSNEIVGWYGDPGVHSFIYSGGIFTPIVFLTDTWAFGINNSGDIVGYGIDWWYHNFLYSGGIFTTIDVPGSTTNWGAKGISNSGDIVGAYGDDLGRHGFLYSGGQFTQIDVPGAVEWTTPMGINNSGDIVGIYANRDEPSKHRGFLISGGIFVPIDVPGATGTDVNGINDHGDIVGRFYDANRGFLYSRGIFTTIHVPGAEWTGASGINNFGSIVGTYGDATGYHGFIATPVRQHVSIDIKPGDDSNCLNLNYHGVIPVAILGSSDLDVYDVDIPTMSLQGLSLKMVGKADRLLAHFDDINGDGYTDLIAQFEDSGGWTGNGDGYATLTGYLLDRTSIEGSDSICLVP